jgi:SAM-dependent methyltransferase
MGTVGMREPAPAGFEDRWRQRFERFANASNDDAGIAGWSHSGLETRLRNFQRLWRTRPAGEAWLDAGCGAGTYSRFLASQGLNMVGLDYSFQTLCKGRERSPQVHRWLVADVTRLPLQSGKLDGAICFGVMQALQSHDRALAELGRVVKPGGEVWVDALNRVCIVNLLANALRRLRGQPAHLRYDSPGRLVATMRNGGFEDVHVHWVLILPSRLHALQPLAESAPVRWLLAHVPGLGAFLSHAFVVRGRRSRTGGGERP